MALHLPMFLTCPFLPVTTREVRPYSLEETTRAPLHPDLLQCILQDIIYKIPTRFLPNFTENLILLHGEKCWTERTEILLHVNLTLTMEWLICLQEWTVTSLLTTGSTTLPPPTTPGTRLHQQKSITQIPLVMMELLLRSITTILIHREESTVVTETVTP